MTKQSFYGHKVNAIFVEILDMVMDNEIANLHEKMRILRVEKLKEENQRLKKALDKKNRNILKNL